MVVELTDVVKSWVDLLSSASYPILIHRLTVYAPRLAIPHSVALMLLRFALLVVINLRWDLHP